MFKKANGIYCLIRKEMTQWLITQQFKVVNSRRWQSHMEGSSVWEAVSWAASYKCHAKWPKGMGRSLERGNQRQGKRLEGLQMIISRPGKEMAGLSTRFILQKPGNVILVDLRNILPEIVHKSQEQNATSSQDLILLSKSQARKQFGSLWNVTIAGKCDIFPHSVPLKHFIAEMVIPWGQQDAHHTSIILEDWMIGVVQSEQLYRLNNALLLKSFETCFPPYLVMHMVLVLHYRS